MVFCTGKYARGEQYIVLHAGDAGLPKLFDERLEDRHENCSICLVLLISQPTSQSDLIVILEARLER